MSLRIRLCALDRVSFEAAVSMGFRRSGIGFAREADGRS